ncbi:MAG: transposase [Actinobacteria bacterium]|nr:transposase [Actinomycetota bacterium]
MLLPPVESAQYVSVAYTERLAEIGARPSIGSIGDSYDNSLAESVNGLYKTELIRRQGPWRNVEHVELATLAWVEWFNTRRLHSELGDIPPAEFESLYYARTRAQAKTQTPTRT